MPTEMASASKVTIKIISDTLPILPKVEELASMGIIPGGMYNNKNYLRNKVKIAEDVSESISDLAFDPQTSGGLLIAVKEDKAFTLIKLLKEKGVEGATVIGQVSESSEWGVILEKQ